MSKFIYNWILIALFLVGTRATFSVYMPQCAIDKNLQPFNYTQANFGHVPYGRTIVGQLVIPKSETEFCEGSEEISGDITDDISWFILIKRGTCKFTKKIINAQKKGFGLAIIYDNQPTSTPNIVMANDGFGHLVDIPSVFISNKDGERIIKTHKQCDQTTIFKMQFDVKTSKIVNMTLWLDANNRQSYITIKDFYRDYFHVIKDKMNLSVRFKIQQKCSRMTCQKSDCIVNAEQYCLQTDIEANGYKMTGKQIIDQHLRSYYLFQQMKVQKRQTMWWKYMKQFDQNLCLQKSDVRDCSKSNMPSIVSFQKIQANVQVAKQNALNNITNPLELFAQSAGQNGILFYPEATINGRNFFGLFRAPDIFTMICQSLEKPPKQCHSFAINERKQTFEDQTTGLWKTVLMIVIIMLITFLAALFIYTRIINREVNQQMSAEVNKMVQHYVSMTEKSNTQMT